MIKTLQLIQKINKNTILNSAIQIVLKPRDKLSTIHDITQLLLYE